MKSWKSAAVIGFVAAVPIELANFLFAMPPLDVDMSPDASWFAQALDFEWAALHLPGILFTNALGPSNLTPLQFLVWILFGYLDTALLVFAAILSVRAIRRRLAALRADKPV
jgi:hypothetical protein